MAACALTVFLPLKLKQNAFNWQEYDLLVFQKELSGGELAAEQRKRASARPRRVGLAGCTYRQEVESDSHET